MQKNRTLVLDYSKWRCGATGDNQLGKGDTQLLNRQGYMCCLGQFSLQLDPTLKKKDLRYNGSPESIIDHKKIPLLTKNGAFTSIRDTNFSTRAITINDDKCTSPGQKIIRLRKLLAKHKYKLKVTNRK